MKSNSEIKNGFFLVKVWLANLFKEMVKKTLNNLGDPGKRLLNYLRLKNTIFKSASAASFSYLDRVGKKKTVDAVYSRVFNEIFILLKSLSLKGDIFEFGVFYGYTSLLLAKKIRQFDFRDTSLHLFDSFSGLPEARGIDKYSYEFTSGVWQKETMSVVEEVDRYIFKKLSRVLSLEKVHVIKGYFENTLETYFAKFRNVKAKLIHLDCDLYSSSKFVFDFILRNEIIQDGTILIFDDWMTSLGNPNLGQRKAVHEVLEKYPMWSIEKYLSYGIGSHVFIAHDLRITPDR